MTLSTYRKRRNFSRSSEPAKSRERGPRTFVVQLHHAARRHYDFRLKLDGVLKSWAVPKGPSFDPAVKRLAVEVEDHPITYADFARDIPEGSYGAGHVGIFDRGTWEPVGSARKSLAAGKLKFTLHGNVLRGSWVLVRTRMRGSKQQWLLIKHRDEFAGCGEADDFVDASTDRPQAVSPPTAPQSRSSTGARKKPGKASKKVLRMPSALIAGTVPERLKTGFFSPELCKTVPRPPAGERWLHEIKWDGYRILASVIRGKVQLWSRNGIEWTGKLPEIADGVTSLEFEDARLDGEVIVLRNGQDSFNALQARLSEQRTQDLLYMLFDIVRANGQSLVDVALSERKAILADLLDKHPHSRLRYSDHQIGNGAAVFKQAIEGGLEGVVSKRVDSTYRGTRSGAWVKAKGRLSDEFIVAGFTEPKGSRTSIGALLLAKPSHDGLHYVGRVGTGFSDDQLTTLRHKLEKSVVETTTVNTDLLPRKDRALALWVKPKLVVEAFYQGIGGNGLLRQPVFKAVRTDKNPGDVSATTVGEENSNPMRQRTRANVATAADSSVITHGDRVVFPELKLTKQHVADYYRAVAPWILPQLSARPLSVVRCPGGIGKSCFFQKHEAKGVGDHVYSVIVPEGTGTDRYLWIDDAAALLELVQLNVLEFHPWGARSSDPDHADRIVFDLDPHATLTFARVRAAARLLRNHLQSIELRSFLLTSGGKGLYVVIPLNPPVTWDDVKAFAHAVADAMVALKPKEFVSVAGESKRKGRIFIDWLRNGRGATSVASYSLRARAAAGVAMPLGGDDLKNVRAADQFNLKNVTKWICKRSQDPWAAIDRIKQELPDF